MNSFDKSASLASEVTAHGNTATNRDLTFEELRHWLSFLIRCADRDITRRFIERFGYHESVSPVALSVLMMISAQPGLDQQQIAEQLDIDKGNAARVIRHLDSAGWLVRKHPDNDRRRQGVYLSPDGARELSRVRRNMRLFERDLAGPFSDDELAQLLSLLQKFHEYHRRDQERP